MDRNVNWGADTGNILKIMIFSYRTVHAVHILETKKKKKKNAEKLWCL